MKYMYNGYISVLVVSIRTLRLLPGHSVTIKSGVWRENRYDNPIDYLSTPNTLALEDHDLLELLDQKIEQSVNYCTVADVPIGILLSAGIDSSLIYSYLKEIYNYSLSVFSFDSEDIHSEYAIARIIVLILYPYVVPNKSMQTYLIRCMALFFPSHSQTPLLSIPAHFMSMFPKHTNVLLPEMVLMKFFTVMVGDFLIYFQILTPLSFGLEGLIASLYQI